MYFTYILRCIDDKRLRKKFYVGTTNDLKTRLKAHKTRSVRTTKSFNIIELVYFEGCLNKTDALRREHQLKTGFGRGYIKRRLENYLNTLLRD